MTINLSVQDIDNYPGVTKTVVLDTDVVVPTGMEGDEKYLISATTSAYSDNENRTSIQDLLIAGGKVGWVKSSGFKGTNGKFLLSASNRRLNIKMDATVSGTTNGYYTITLNYDAGGLALRGEDIAADIQNKIRSIHCSGVDIGYQMAYKSCSVKFENNKFFISSGTISNHFTGSSRSSVDVAPVSGDDCYAILGFDQKVTSEELAYITILEAPLLSNYTADNPTLVVDMTTGISEGDVIYITDGINSDKTTVLNASLGTLTVPVSGTNGFTGIKHNYSVSDGSYIQVMNKTDPDQEPNSYCKDTDELLRYMAKILINQIDFSS